jgi:hypothetical protein
MTKQFNIKGEMNPGSWFPFEPMREGQTIDDVGGVCIRVMNQGAVNEMEKKTRTYTVEYRQIGRGQGRQRFEYYKPVEGAKDIEFEMMWDYCVVDWKGVLDDNKKPIPCTKENKIALMQGSVEFMAFVNDCQKQINTDIGIMEENLEGN